MTRAKALLLTLAVFVLGGAGYWGFSAAGFEDFDAGIAASVSWPPSLLSLIHI